MTDTSAAQRHDQRHNHISIRLHYLWEADWHPIEAQQWNAQGFCFFHASALPLGGLEFKRSLLRFQGEITWTRACGDAQQVLEMLVNEAIHQQAKRLHADAEMQQRLLSLMRVQGMMESKQRVLTALGGQFSPAQWQDRVQQRLAQPLFQSGVRVESALWGRVVENAMTVGSVVQDLERWSNTLGEH